MDDALTTTLPSTRSGRLASRSCLIEELAPDEREAMWSVFARYYADVARDAFDQDLEEKTAVILLRDSGDDSIQGFSTLRVYRRRLGRRSFIAVFSGDTVLHHEYWGQKQLQREFFRFMLRLKLSNPWTPVYWFLITKGYKTYLLLTRNFPTHWPRHHRSTPSWEQRLIEFLAVDRFGDDYHPGTGTLQFSECKGRVRDGIAPIDASLLSDPDIRFFVSRNPGYSAGNELCCVGRVDFKQLAFLAARLVFRRRRRALGTGKWAVAE